MSGRIKRVVNLDYLGFELVGIQKYQNSANHFFFVVAFLSCNYGLLITLEY